MMNVIFDAEDQTPKSIRSTLKLPGLEPCTHGRTVRLGPCGTSQGNNRLPRLAVPSKTNVIKLARHEN